MEGTSILLLSAIILGQLLCQGVVHAQPLPVREPSEPFDGHVNLVNADRYVLFWKTDSKSITFEVHVKTKGWVGFGLSPNGGMANSDMVIGWVKDGRVYFQDRYATSNAMPMVDTSQDWEILEGRETANHTILKFKRPLYSCDPQDLNVTRGITRLMYAYSDVDPSSEDSILYHGSTRGSKSIDLFYSQEKAPELPKDAFYRDFVHTDVLIPSASTTYWCHGFHVTEFNGQKHHLIKVEPIIPPGNEWAVHHILLYACYNAPIGIKERPEESFKCFVNNMPWDVCNTVIVGWAVGGKNFTYPSHVGHPFGNAGGIQYLRMETHYDNPNHITGTRDSSGLRLWFTPTVREYDVGVLIIGMQVNSAGQILPSGYPSIINVGLCSKECLSEAMSNQSEINVFASLMHMHLTGIGAHVHHYRDGVEKPYLDQEMSYDFNYQEVKTINPEVVIKKGDNLLMECRYNTMKKNAATVGGLGTNEEMCFGYLMYYPQITLNACTSMPTQAHMAKELNFKYRKVTKFVPPINYAEWAVITEGPYTNMTFTEYINEIKGFSNEADKKQYQHAITTGDVIQVCWNGPTQILKAHGKVTQIPIVTEPYIPDVQPCGNVIIPNAPHLDTVGSNAPPSVVPAIVLLLTVIHIFMI